jgi:hypothetical protein
LVGVCLFAVAQDIIAPRNRRYLEVAFGESGSPRILLELRARLLAVFLILLLFDAEAGHR